jgi:hypothetical protein
LEASEWFAKSGYKAAATDNAEEASGMRWHYVASRLAPCRAAMADCSLPNAVLPTSETHKRNSPEENAGWLSQASDCSWGERMYVECSTLAKCCCLQDCMAEAFR